MEIVTKKRYDYRAIDLLYQRQIQESISRHIDRKLKVTPNFISRLGLEAKLDGHDGCVNCLEWNESGTILASASDDMHVILWDPFRYEKKLTLHTKHGGNIFTVKFMPKSNDSILVTGAGDFKIRVHDIAISDTLLVCNCHFGRVKRVATVPNLPFLFWSAAEDGLIIQHDLRQPHSCKSGDQRRLLVNLSNHMNGIVEAKCISINPRRPELVAVGANDAYVRMYDRRMIKPSHIPISAASNNLSLALGKGDPDNNIPLGCAQYFVAGHLKCRDNRKRFSTTYLTFNDDGTELLVNMGEEQIYLFDINNHGNSKNFVVPVEFITNSGDQDCKDSYVIDSNNSSIVLEDLSALNITQLTPEVEELRQQANQAFDEYRYAHAITLYNKAISLCPNAAVLYGNRAGTYMKRLWDGDCYAALRDCRITLALDPEHVKAHYRLAKCLFDLKKVNEAYIVMKNFREKFPEYINNSACNKLKSSIKEEIRINKQLATTKKAYETNISEHEKEWRQKAIDYKIRLCGHCNNNTDIKEANFFGDNGQYIIAGSDEGSFFIWDRSTTNIARILKGDPRIVNCLQPHPSICLLATSGIDPFIKLWSPMPEDGRVNAWEIKNQHEAATANYIRMNTDERFDLDLMLFNMGYRLRGQNSRSTHEDNQDSSNTQPLNCRPS
ncbi:PREDICTED: WD and tetratricopeptide repeats protein 1-like [Ceratosolen solmsi marchali]|uniref:WD and tetratricopeptide repeats protein 1-like n=1 Tax=Ceratosolen solmsi marchali TaxID=326594 RepID=A0AAJ7DYF1_9HYME|nr:PREDICTED: WD and tetratricopeptide repeats protein 1-like [Ceratosolen solmsi marchali]